MSKTVEKVNTVIESEGGGKQNDVDCKPQPCLQVPSADVQDNMNENMSGSGDTPADDTSNRKRRKTRRGKSKRPKMRPYGKLSWKQRRAQEDKDSKRADFKRAKMFAHGQPVAPYNTTQFLMEDHNDVKNLDVKLQAVTTNAERTLSTDNQKSRIRDSSFSLDSDEDYFYSSPEDEGEFLTKEFSNTYRDLHAERLNNMTKSQLIQEYLQLEQRVDVLQKNLMMSTSAKEIDDSNENMERCDEHLGSGGGEEMCTFQQRVNTLLVENERLRIENEHLRCSMNKTSSVSSSIDSESDSSSSASCSSAVSSCSESDNDIAKMEDITSTNDADHIDSQQMLRPTSNDDKIEIEK
uniref:Hexamethylene bis-acetamide-inducible protein n=2 Tax=Timema TaxID=61471 RepID=A0A7R9FFB7_9NEOP|nr:unnamed protein product [Timema bartmani]CAD7452537.1 unnamed protein product [Timema tahoe]